MELYFSFELGRLFGERLKQCDNAIFVNNALLDIRELMMKNSDNKYAFIIRPEIFEYFTRYFDSYQDKEHSLRDLIKFTERIFSDENFLCQKMMDYVRSYINHRNLERLEIDQVARFALERKLSRFDPDLNGYYENYKESLSKYQEGIENKELLETIFVYIYTYFYLEELESDFDSILENIDLPSLIKSFEMYKIDHDTLRSNLTIDNPSMRKLIEIVNEKINIKKDKKKVLTHTHFRGHIYI